MATANVVGTENNLKNRKVKKRFILQWHITAKCDQNCIHCYTKDSRTYRQEIENQLSFNDCKKVIDSFSEFCNKIEAKPHITFTGGDPLLCEDFFDIIEYARHFGITISILGNPNHLTEDVLLKLKENGVRSYQISIDGLEKIHDSIRGKGSFNISIKALENLKKYNIRTVVMFTLSKQNADDLIPVMNLVSELKVDAFAFARVCGLGKGKNLETFTAQEYRGILLNAYEEEKKLILKGSKTLFNKKDPLWVLLLTELGEFHPNPQSTEKIYSGCPIGCRSFTILSDGTAFACRRFYSPIGKVTEQSIEDIFLSEELDKYRNINFEKCSKCSLFAYCRGCPAVAYGVTGNLGSPDPHCWKEL
jgi:radical SAM/SPASM domain protein of ACGX system